MLDICKQFSIESDMKFNPSKCQLVICSSHGQINDTVYFDGYSIKSNVNATHLGSVIGQNVYNAKMEKSINDMVINANSLSSMFYNVDEDIKYKLFKTYAMSFYGSPLWDLSHNSIEHLYTTSRKCIRKLFHIPYRTHNKYISCICNDLPINLQLCNRFVKFIHNALNNDNECIKLAVKYACNGSGSTICNNMNYISNIINVPKVCLFGDNSISISNIITLITECHSPSNEILLASQQILDLLSLRRTDSSFDEMLQMICTQ